MKDQMSPEAQPTRNEVEINLLRLVQRLEHGAGRIGIWVFAGVVVGLVMAFTAHAVYSARAVFMPPVKETTGQGAALLLTTDSSDLYLGMLESRTVADAVVDRLRLLDVYKVKTKTRARAMLATQSSFDVTKNELITVTVKTRDPKLSAAIGNAYLDALYELNGAMAASSSLHRSEFVEAQLNVEKEALMQTEASVKQVQEKTGTVLPEGTAQAGLTAAARLQSTIEEAQAQLATLLTSETDRNPEVVDLKARIATLEGQLQRQQSSQADNSGNLPSAAKLPGLLMESLRATRDLKDRERLYESLQQQYDRARLGALDPGPQLQIVDRAAVPEEKSGPSRKLIVLEWTFAGFAFGILSLFLPGGWQKLQARYRAFKVPVTTPESRGGAGA